MTNEPPREVWLERTPSFDVDDSGEFDEMNGAEVWSSGNSLFPHKYILADRVEKMIRLAVLEYSLQGVNTGDPQLNAMMVAGLLEEINQLREELQ